MTSADRLRRDPASDFVRDPLANRAAVLAARLRPLSVRLEVALSWNLTASQLRSSLAEVRSADRRR